MFSFVSITIWPRIPYSSALQSQSPSQKVHVFPAALTLLQKALKVSFLTWTNRLNSKFRIIGFSVGLQCDRSSFRKWSHVLSLDRGSFGSAAFQSWISLAVAENARSFLTLLFRDPPVFYKFNICICRFFFCCCSPFCNTSFNCVFRRFRILCFKPKLVLFNELVKSLQGSMWKPIRIKL